jgi:hypothetical protein
MYKFERKQEQISKQADAVTRQHAIPIDVKKYAIEVQMRMSEKVRPGVGRKNQPTLADIYERLVNEGLKVVNANDQFYMVVEETGNPTGATQVRISFTGETDDALRDLKSKIDDGKFEIMTGSGRKKKATQISLIGLAVNMMRLAIQIEKKNAYKNSLVDFYQDKGMSEADAKAAAFATILSHKSEGMPKKIETP